MTLVWTVPLVAANVALIVVLVRVRKLEDVSLELADTMRRLRGLRRPLTQLRRALDDGQPPVDKLWRHWRD